VVQVWVPERKDGVIHREGSYNARMAMSKQSGPEKQEDMWIAHTELAVAPGLSGSPISDTHRGLVPGRINPRRKGDLP